MYVSIMYYITIVHYSVRDSRLTNPSICMYALHQSVHVIFQYSLSSFNTSYHSSHVRDIGLQDVKLLIK